MADVEPSNRALESLINRNHADNREDILDLKSQVTREITNLVDRMQQYVLREVYDADRRAQAAREQVMNERLGSLQTQVNADRREAKDRHKSARTNFWMVAGGLLAAVATVVLTTWTHGGMH